jgi:hypothetical protein
MSNKRDKHAAEEVMVEDKGEDQTSNIFTKTLVKPLFKNYKQMIEMKDIRDSRLKEDVESYSHQISNPSSRIPQEQEPEEKQQ